MDIDIERITPEKAQVWLGNNPRNRALNQSRVAKLAGAIARGEWSLNGESIKFNGNGALIDGQTRLSAVVASQKTIESVVVRGLETKAQETIDIGTARNLSNIFQIRGEANASTLAAAVSMYHRYLRRLEGKAGGVIGNTYGGNYPTPQQGIMVLEQNPGLRETLKPGYRLNATFRVPPGTSSFCAYVITQLDQEDAEYFLDRTVSGVGLKEGDPIFALRNRLQTWLVERSTPTARKIASEEYAAHILKAWNHFRDGNSIKVLGWRRGGRNPEPFPIAR